MAASFRVKLLASHAIVALLVGAVTLVVVDRQVSRRMEQQVDQRLEVQAKAVAQWMERAAHPKQLSRRLAGVVDARVTLLDAHGKVLGDSIDQGAAGTAGAGDIGAVSEDSSPEVRAAREGRVGFETRESRIDGQPVRYVAVAAPDNQVVRLGVPIGEIDETKSELRKQLIGAAIVSVLVALGLAFVVVGPLTRRLRDVTLIARRFGAGDYDVAAPPPGRDEIGVLAHTLATAGSELRANEQRRRDFLANVAHEIRTPVTSIRGYAQILSSAPVEPETGKEFLQTIHRNAVRIGELVEDLLELEALEAGQGPPLAREQVAIAPIAQHVVETLRARAAEVGGELVIAVGDVTARGDADAIERIVLNLADNALRHGGTGVVVTLDARRTADATTITVHDTGGGVPPEDRAHIFDRFQRGTAQRDPSRPGSGLGLAIARELAHAMGGTLELSGGSTFTLTLPA
ncbi:MAG TPA: ATP-binding protein [Kofleriaceae bacterium]|nr:ATP-binding protein [Kofleriaceae bacterium]